MQSPTLDHERMDSERRPRLVLVATLLFGVFCFADVVGFVNMWFRPFSWFELLFSTGMFAFSATVVWGLYAGRQWARSLTAGVILLSIPTAIFGPLFVMNNGWLLAALMFRLCAGIGLFVVLSRNSVSQWYARSRG